MTDDTALREMVRAAKRYVECSIDPALSPFIRENGRYGTKSPWSELREAIAPAEVTLTSPTPAQPVQSVHQFDADDMEAVGRSLMETIESNRSHPLLKDWAPTDDPAEIVADLLNAYDEKLAPAQPEDVVERVARALYACEKERSDHTGKVLSAAKGHPVNFRMEPWDDVAELYRGDARAAIAAAGGR
ncbi:hypothetical protein G432_05010 [Sphingomonas sp. MM-1]|uniref:hypothetical protein n=1 Tax=Sphingomonas sp. MM-1 TaxID=745310 RepID=UPI0002C13AB4|nr:hypothetical protein [Sphingomonas sp. MM-1]AGH48729.1 hypothetical protein G432_05010 [Sphingomonas sp. MM-1]